MSDTLPEITADQAHEIITNVVIGHFRGTLYEHEQVQTALAKLKPDPVP